MRKILFLFICCINFLFYKHKKILIFQKKKKMYNPPKQFGGYPPNNQPIYPQYPNSNPTYPNTNPQPYPNSNPTYPNTNPQPYPNSNQTYPNSNPTYPNSGMMPNTPSYPNSQPNINRNPYPSSGNQNHSFNNNPTSKEMKLFINPKEKEVYENQAELYSILKTTDAIDKAANRDSISERE